MKWKTQMQEDLSMVVSRLQTYRYLADKESWPLSKRLARYWQRRDELTDEELEDLKELQSLSEALKVIDVTAQNRADLEHCEWEF